MMNKHKVPPVIVTHTPNGGCRQRVIARCDDIPEAEDFIAMMEQVDPEGVHRGDYGIDPPEEMT